MAGPAVLALAAAVCLSGSVNDLLTKITANIYTQKYAFFVDQGCNLLYTVFAAIPVAWAIAYERTGSLVDRLPEGLLRCPQRRYAFMGLLDALGTFLSSVGAPGTPGHLQVMLCQTLILFTMVTAYVWMGTRHDAREVVCASLIFGGAMVAASGSASAEDGAAAQLWSMIMFTLSNVPMALSNVYKELAFADKSLRLDVWSMTCVTTFYQTAATFLLLPLQTLPYMSGDPQRGMSLAESWQSFVGGAACYFGRSSDGVDCGIAGPLLTMYVLANLFFNFLSFCLMKLGSATGVGSVLCSLAYAVKMPISNLLFSQPLLMGSQAEELSSRSLFGLVIVVAGFLGYLYFSGPGKGDAQEKLEAARKAATPSKAQDAKEVAASDQSATPYVFLGHDDDGVRPLARTLVESAQAIPDDAEPWAFHDRLVGCDSSNSARLVSSRELQRGLAELMCGAEALRQPVFDSESY